MAKPVSGIKSFRDRQKARDLARRAAYLALRHASAVHYTQGASRWQGIDQHLRAYLGQYPHYADCSAFVTWCLWNGLHHFHRPDVVNGDNWKGGYTGTMLAHGRSVLHRPWHVGDAVIYGPHGSTGEHTAMIVDRSRRLVISHGSEGGPYLLPFNYRGDVEDVRRYI